MPANEALRSADRSRGVLYVASGLEHIRAAVKSAQSVRKTNPQLPIHLFADLNQSGFEPGAKLGVFTSWENIPDPHPRSKVDYFAKTPFEETLFLDNDTRVLCDLSEPFDLLRRFDMALPHSPKREFKRKERFWRGIPKAFPEFNAGVIFYRKNDRVLETLAAWRKKFAESQARRDQPALREVLWASDLRIATLPPEYNVRFLKYLFVWSKDEAKPKILHLAYFREGLGYYLKFWVKKW